MAPCLLVKVMTVRDQIVYPLPSVNTFDCPNLSAIGHTLPQSPFLLVKQKVENSHIFRVVALRLHTKLFSVKAAILKSSNNRIKLKIQRAVGIIFEWPSSLKGPANMKQRRLQFVWVLVLSRISSFIAFCL